jgi:hypothetical protein
VHEFRAGAVDRASDLLHPSGREDGLNNCRQIIAERLRDEHFGLLREAVSEAGRRGVKTPLTLMTTLATLCAAAYWSLFPMWSIGAAQPNGLNYASNALVHDSHFPLGPR